MVEYPYLVRDNGLWWLTEDEGSTMKVSYAVDAILFDQRSPLQHVMVVHSLDFGAMLVLDGVVQTTAFDGFIYNEMISHIPLRLHSAPRRVLIIGGGDLGAAREVCKYASVERVDLVEIDELVVRACRQYLPEVSGPVDDARLHCHYRDGVEFVRQAERSYDVILVDSSDPVGPAQQLFSRDFYASIGKALKGDGIMVCQSQSPLFHQSVLRTTYGHVSQLFATAALYTAVVPSYPGGFWSFTLGSKQPLHTWEAARDLPSDTQYVTEAISQRCFVLPNFLEQLLGS